MSTVTVKAFKDWLHRHFESTDFVLLIQEGTDELLLRVDHDLRHLCNSRSLQTFLKERNIRLEIVKDARRQYCQKCEYSDKVVYMMPTWKLCWHCDPGHKLRSTAVNYTCVKNPRWVKALRFMTGRKATYKILLWMAAKNFVPRVADLLPTGHPVAEDREELYIRTGTFPRLFNVTKWEFNPLRIRFEHYYKGVYLFYREYRPAKGSSCTHVDWLACIEFAELALPEGKRITVTLWKWHREFNLPRKTKTDKLC